MSQAQRYFPNGSSPLSKVSDSRSELVHSLSTLVQGAPPCKPWNDVYKGLFLGPTSIAYVFLWLNKTHPKLLIDGRNAKKWCLKYLDCGSDEIPLSPLNPKGIKMGFKNEFVAWRAVKAAVTQDMNMVDEAIEGVKKLHESIDKGENELFDGRAGTLMLLRIIKFWVPESEGRVNEVMGVLIEHILARRPWIWYENEFLGAAHGSAGIVAQVVLCDPSTAGRLEGVIEELLDQQNRDGNWFLEVGVSDKKDLVQWCHGSPGIIVSLMAIRKLFPGLKEKLDTAIVKGRKNIWERGVLVKEPCLCHGTSGNMLCFDRAEEREHLMTFATHDFVQQGIKDGSIIEGTDMRYGLLFGEPGRAWAWMVIDSGENLGFPAYTES